MDLSEQQVREISQMGAKGRALCRDSASIRQPRQKAPLGPIATLISPSRRRSDNYVRFADEWQRDLSDALKLDVRLAQYNCRASDAARRACDDHGRK
jgi:hypothetical protein